MHVYPIGGLSTNKNQIPGLGHIVSSWRALAAFDGIWRIHGSLPCHARIYDNLCHETVISRQFR